MEIDEIISELREASEEAYQAALEVFNEKKDQFLYPEDIALTNEIAERCLSS
ncbi:MAG: hypothetical protein AAF720_15540 [Pseudomonadota bacterium]